MFRFVGLSRTGALPQRAGGVAVLRDDRAAGRVMWECTWARQLGLSVSLRRFVAHECAPTEGGWRCVFARRLCGWESHVGAGLGAAVGSECFASWFVAPECAPTKKRAVALRFCATTVQLGQSCGSALGRDICDWVFRFVGLSRPSALPQKMPVVLRLARRRYHCRNANCACSCHRRLSLTNSDIDSHQP